MSSKNGHGLRKNGHSNTKSVNFPNGPVYYDPPYVQPKDVRITCNICSPPVHFSGSDAFKKVELHDLFIHQNKHGR